MPKAALELLLHDRSVGWQGTGALTNHRAMGYCRAVPSPSPSTCALLLWKFIFVVSFFLLDWVNPEFQLHYAAVLWHSAYSCLFVSDSITPIFTLSSVSGENLDLLKVFLNILPPLTNSKEQEELMQQLTEFQVCKYSLFLVLVLHSLL